MIDPEDLAAFHAAVADITPLPPVNRVQLAKSRLRRVAPPASQQQEAAAPTRQRREPGLPSQWLADSGKPRATLPADPDQAAFQMAMRGVEPMPSANRVHLGTPPPPPRPQQFVADEQAALHESLHGPIGLQDRLEGGDEPNYLGRGLAGSVLKDLRRGRWVLQGELDLHGLNRDAARHQLAGFLATCLHHGKRCVRIIHGKGHGSPQKLSILRQLVRGWLAQRSEVLAYCQALPQDGGEGALIVLLRAQKTRHG